MVEMTCRFCGYKEEPTVYIFADSNDLFHLFCIEFICQKCGRKNYALDIDGVFYDDKYTFSDLFNSSNS